MFWTNVKRVIRAGWVNFWRNGFVSLSSVLVMIITLTTIAGVILVGAVLNASLDQLKSKVDINVYISQDADEQSILALKKVLESRPEIKSVTYTSKDQALADFKAKHPEDGTTAAIDELGYNPLQAVLNIQAKDPSQYESIAKFLQSPSALDSGGQNIVSKVSYYEHESAIKALTRVIDSSRKLGLILSIVLMLVSVLITFNTIRLIIYTAREEISVMRLVGASNKYIRGPFVVSGIMYGLAAALITLFIFFPITYYLRQALQSFFVGIDLFQYYLINFGQMFLITVLAGMCIGAVSSYLAVHRYLRT